MLVTLAYQWNGHEPDTTLEVDDETGRSLLRSGRARIGKRRPDTAADVLAQVGNDPDAALAAIRREEGSPKPRAGLIAALGKIANPTGD